ncbi:MAG: BlaI/MecI/CopY family transcriptional regulator [Sideroxyarcus sp.]|nr:BlaI/MecI/CopY family transcriptional regulator [Sideroxyarcus sp.]
MLLPNLPILGDLEKAVLDDLWMNQSGDPNAVHQRVGVIREISLHTVQSTLERLYRKTMLERTKIRHSFVYSPRLSREETMSSLIGALLASFGQTASTPMLSAFVEYAASVDESNLGRLEDLIAIRRADHPVGS